MKVARTLPEKSTTNKSDCPPIKKGKKETLCLLMPEYNDNNLVADDVDFTASFDELRWIVKWKSRTGDPSVMSDRFL